MLYMNKEQGQNFGQDWYSTIYNAYRWNNDSYATISLWDWGCESNSKGIEYIDIFKLTEQRMNTIKRLV